jgi:hypothetical protein
MPFVMAAQSPRSPWQKPYEEHRDNLQEKPAAANPSGHPMIDGPTETTDLNKTETNKALVRSSKIF